MAELLATGQSYGQDSQVLNTFLQQGEKFARTGQLDQSFQAFSNAFRVGFVPKERITSLVEAFLEFQRNKLCREKKEEAASCDDSFNSLFNCTICSGVFMKPVTLPCGHTFCEVCLSQEKSFTRLAECSKCGNVIPEDTVHSVNVLIMNAIQKWLPLEYQRQGIKLKGHDFLVGNNVEAAIDCFNTVLSEANDDIHCLCWRADGFLRLGKLELALQDIEQACKLRSSLARTFYIKSVILRDYAKLEGILSTKHEESVLALLRCYSLAPKCERYRQEFTECLYQLLSPKFTNLNRTLSVLKQGQSRTGRYNNPAESSNVETQFTNNSAGVGKKTGTKTQTDACPNNGALQVKPVQSKLSKDALHLREVEDFECKLCFTLLFQPVTTICGHTFCRECLERCLDHRVACPCCRTTLDQYHKGTRKMEITQELESILFKFFPVDYSERMKAFHEKINAHKSLGDNQNQQVPIFVCTLAVPKVKCPLHIFEPRYRLMLRRCMESGSRQFGMCVGNEDPEKNFADYGTMLNVQSVNYLPDGRSIVQTEGGRRFHVLSRGMVDGYDTATVEWVRDECVDDEDELKEIIELNRVGYITLQTWFSHMTVEQCQCITNAIGPVPAFDENLQLLNDGPDWVWWTLAALPLTDKPKLIILSMTSILERLQSVIRFLRLMLSLQKKSANTTSSLAS